METEIINEGELELEVPNLEDYRTSPNEYVPSQTPVFFNPLMELSRDISVSSLQVLKDDLGELKICDVLAGVGARGLRYAKEVEEVDGVIVNDISPEAVDLIRKNIEHNELSKAEASREDGNLILRKNHSSLSVVDLDPFGTPVPFLDSSFSALSRGGILLVTATDTAPLCGAYSKACVKRYGARPLRTSYSRELGLRILLGSVQRRAASQDVALYPVLAHATQHFFRIHFRSERGAKPANKILKKQGYVSHCFKCGRRYLTEGMTPALPEKCECGRDLNHAGPVWLGDLGDKDHLEKVIEDLSTRGFELEKDEKDLLRLCRIEVGGKPFFYDIHEVSSRANVSPPKIDVAMRELQKQGYEVTRTQFSDTGLRTEAPIEVLTDIIAG